MPQGVAWRTAVRLIAILVASAALLAACAKDPVRLDRNRPPHTYLVSAPPESGSYSYRIHLYWRGEDPDGYVVGYQWSWDDSSVTGFHFTTKTDSIFELLVNDSAAVIGGNGNTLPSTSRAHTFFIRAIDNLGKPDPNLIVFNKRIINSRTLQPTVTFKPPLVPRTDNTVDTLCNGQPFEVCWTGSDPDGYVIGYKYTVGAYNSPIVSDSCVTFNDPNDPNAVGLSSGLYTLTVQSIDNAFALSDPGSSKLFFVVNRDPVAWFKNDSGGRGDEDDPQNPPVGYYIAPFHRGEQIPPVMQRFYPGQTVPFRSTVWWQWDGEDPACDSPNGVASFSLSGQVFHRNNEPYITGFLSEITPGVPFKTNDPASLDNSPIANLILDSLDAGNGLQMVVRARDVSNRISGTQFSGRFTFNCNFPPHISGFDVQDSCFQGRMYKYFTWAALDEEDGFPGDADLAIENNLLTITTHGGASSALVPWRTFRDFSADNPHTAELRVYDRAGAVSPERPRLTFDIGPTSAEVCTLQTVPVVFPSAQTPSVEEH